MLSKCGNEWEATKFESVDLWWVADSEWTGLWDDRHIYYQMLTQGLLSTKCT